MPNSFQDITEHVEQVTGLVRFIQIDMCDGRFVQNKTFPFQPKDAASVEALMNESVPLPAWEDIEYEFDLMVTDASKRIEDWVRMGARRLVFHIDAESNLLEELDNLDYFWREQVDIGLAIRTTTDIETLDSYINYIDYIQCMGIEQIGYQGQDFDPRVLNQVHMLKEKYPDLPVQVDGSVNHQTAERLVSAGADRLIVGSSFWNALSPEDELDWYRAI